jgi:hypothetical protein
MGRVLKKTCLQPYNENLNLNFLFKERLPALVRDLFTFSSKVIKMFMIHSIKEHLNVIKGKKSRKEVVQL